MTEKPDVHRLIPGTASYPEAVSAVWRDKAMALHVIGNEDLLKISGIGFCGSRKSSEKGLAAAFDCADQASSMGFAVISGNAAGVDCVAHRTALEAGGKTILVLPEGIEHFRVRREFQPVWDWERVLVVSQFEPSVPWQSYRAMERNNLIIALSLAMVVIEAGAKGGTLHAGISTLNAKKPLFVATYENMEVDAPGNALLIERGGIALKRSRTTGRGNIEPIRSVIHEGLPRIRSPQSAFQQMALL